LNEQQSPRPLISVVIPTYNADAYIESCLDSVFSQHGDFQLDVIVVDDGSRDDTVARVRGCGHPVRCVEQANAGPAAARNTALRMARGDFIAYLDSDDLWPPGKLANQIALLQAHSDIGLLFGDCRQFDQQGEFSETLFEGSFQAEDFWGDPLYVLQPYAKLLRGNFITTGSIVMRRACLEQVGLFDEGLRLVEDLECWLRIALAFPIAHLDEVCLLRRRHQENTSRDQVAMSLAFLHVLQRHWERYADQIRAQGADLGSRVTAEYQELGHLYMRRGAHREAARAYLRSLARRPGIRPAYYLMSALVAGAGTAIGKG